MEAINIHISKYPIASQDLNRPWGGFYCIDSSATNQFIEDYFSKLNLSTQEYFLSPKLLVINPKQRLSWQYHNRRKEIWSILQGPVGIMRSHTDDQSSIIIANTGDIIMIDVEERHRLIGLDNLAIVAELWDHTDSSNPSNEEDIIRVQDDFQR